MTSAFPIPVQERESVDPTLDLEAEILRLKEERNAVILAHYYQDSEIQDLADFVGDSLGLSQQAAKTDADVIAFCGVHFMAETAKILNPEKTVVMPDTDAGCSLADRCPPEAFAEWLKQYPDHAVVSYINTSAAIKALSDIICTSSNAVDVVASIPADKPIVFAPDRHLGRWVERQTGREDGAVAGLLRGPRAVHRAPSAGDEARTPGRRPDRPPRVRAGRARPRRLHRLDGEADRARAHEPEDDVHRRDRDGHPAPDAEGPARRAS